ncbi:hypothetical protein B0E47_12180 [Rhodanobacter sp. B05]|uniref:UPF0149 family protein n=1 Tax=Rhodanobacter sp. B05 TaxID=1945859 RepID=UPI000986442F|nr:UPF0149 family protein [Rhodanobacter sp. B05]OOG53940.1 hypothetical protein B0E47_12180 [Rhodanobacter sp. B05]
MTDIDGVSHDELAALGVRLRLGSGASELHGSLTGYLAGGGSLRGRPVLAALELDGEAVDASAPDQAQLDRLAQQTRAGLADTELGFEPLLPDDDRPLAERAEAMVDWCRGFLGGFGLGGAAAHAPLSDEAQEILRDLGTVAGSSFDFGNESEDEDALIEVHEFVRMAAMLLFTECNTGDPSRGGTLH